ncbi:protein TIFY 5A-like [Cucumis melo var. makuwa]|uniref:Protein TIFY 5A-like n=2 Tax=Cucumis melo TaxID=3656 RepID=A0A5D3CWX6_CUCMM|nr:protein TIFY 5A-like [Cucumis melo var. makuwa]
MGREFSLELGLWPSASEPTFQFSAIPMMALPFTLNHHQQQQQIMVFYNGALSLCDFTELQARAILWIGSQERSRNVRCRNPEWLNMQMLKSGNGNGNAGFSIKKSLQRFLQRRKMRRIRTMSPYHKL